jgi:hypothetical protein
MRRRRLLAATLALSAARPLRAQAPRGVRIGILAPNLRHPGPPAI